MEKMTKCEVKNLAILEGAENRAPFDTWPKTRLPEFPDAGILLRKEGRWFIGVAGRFSEGSKGNHFNVYASWREVPAAVCADWEDGD